MRLYVVNEFETSPRSETVPYLDWEREEYQLGTLIKDSLHLDARKAVRLLFELLEALCPFDRHIPYILESSF